MKYLVALLFVILVAAGIAYDQYTERRFEAQSAARDAMLKAALGAIDAQRTQAVSERAALRAERDALQREIATNKRALVALEGRSKVAGDATARDKVAADALMASPSYEALQGAAQRLRVTVKPVVR